METNRAIKIRWLGMVVAWTIFLPSAWILWEFRPPMLGELKAHETGHVIGFWHSEVPVVSAEVSFFMGEGVVKTREISGTIDMIWRASVAGAAGAVAQQRHSGRTYGSGSDDEKLVELAQTLIKHGENGFLPTMPWDRETRLTATIENVIESSRARAKVLLVLHADEFDKVFNALDTEYLSHDQISQLLGPQRVD